MEYKIRMHESGKFFITEVSGEITAENAPEYIIASRKFSEKNNIDFNLLDARNATNNSSVLQNYNFGYKDDVVKSSSKTGKIAVLVNENDDSHDFVLTVLKNAGFDIEIFTSFDKASDWLMDAAGDL